MKALALTLWCDRGARRYWRGRHLNAPLPMRVAPRIFPCSMKGRSVPARISSVVTTQTSIAEPLPERFRRPGGETALRVRYSSGDQLRFELVEPAPDWHRYGVLAIDLTNPAATPLKMTLRILDAQHNWASNDRLNLPLVIPAQTRPTVRIALAAVEAAPVRRRMDLSRIANLMLYANRPPAGTEFYVSRIWLE